MDKVKTIAHVAHDNRKADLAEWVDYYASKLSKYHLIYTGITGKMVEDSLAKSIPCSEFLQKILLIRKPPHLRRFLIYI